MPPNNDDRSNPSIDKTGAGAEDGTVLHHSRRQAAERKPGDKTHSEPDATLASSPGSAHGTNPELPTMEHGSDQVGPSSGGTFKTGKAQSTRHDRPLKRSTGHDHRSFGHDQRFEIISSHAKGGLGEVFLARDASLDRQVALKEMQPGVSQHVESRERFEFEARVTGNLEHPCIVPVYAIGCHNDGRPFYAMRFIRGSTLQESIRDFHANHPVSKQRWFSADFRALLARLIATCNGIAFAHSKGVIHRDVKPANIMLGRYGETLIVDWGLAKYVGQPDISLSHADTMIPSISGSSPSMTVQGSALGTPGYMSPEQAAGNLDELTAPTDIFSLGATLYAALTGKPPFEGTSAKTVIDKVKRLDFRHPRDVDRTIPKPLEAICLKAMSGKPGDRYESALDLARDLEQFLAGEPVSCFAEPIVTRTARYLRKHQTTAVSATLLLLTATVGSIAGMTLIGAEQQKTKTALNQVVAEQSRTQAALDAENAARVQTRESLTLITDDLVGQMLARKDHLEPADHALLEAILKRFESFTSIAGETDEAIEIRSDGFRRVGNLQRRLGQIDKAVASYKLADDLLKDLLSRNPDNAGQEFVRALVISNLGLAEADRGNDTAALDHYSQSAEILERLNKTATDSINDDVPLTLAQLLGNRANVLSRLGQAKKSEADYLDALRLLEAGSNDETPKAHSVAHRRELARHRSGFASLLATDPQRKVEAAAVYRQAVAGYRELAAELNSAPDISYELGVALASQGSVHADIRDSRNAEVCFREAVSLSDELVKNFPGFFRYQLLLGRNRMLLGKELAGQHVAAARQELAGSESILRQLNNGQTGNPRVQHELAELLTFQASLEKEDAATASRKFSDALALRKELQAIDPDNDTWADELIATEINLANHLRKSGEHRQAIVHYTELLGFLDGRDPLDPRLIRATLFGLGDCHSQLKQYFDALPCWERLVKNSDDPARSRFELQRAICLVRVGRKADGLSAAQSAAEKFGEKEPVIFYDAACCFAIASADDANLPDEATTASLPNQALELLGLAQSAGFFADASMRRHAASDHDLDTLRKLPAFTEFCKQHDIVEDAGSDF